MGGGGERSDFFEKCSLLVDRLGRTGECYIEIEQKGGALLPLKSCFVQSFIKDALLLSVTVLVYN